MTTINHCKTCNKLLDIGDHKEQCKECIEREKRFNKAAQERYSLIGEILHVIGLR